MSNVIDINSYEPEEGEKFFFDANVWIYLFCPLSDFNKVIVEKYNRFFVKILQNKGQIYTSAMVISEFFNTYTRIEFNFKKETDPQKYQNYKRDFRNTEAYSELAREICKLIDKRIFKHSIRIDDNFANINIHNLLSCDSTYDFNDNYFVELCKNNDLKIVTNDRDFLSFKQDIDIVTSWRS